MGRESARLFYPKFVSLNIHIHFFHLYLFITRSYIGSRIVSLYSNYNQSKKSPLFFLVFGCCSPFFVCWGFILFFCLFFIFCLFVWGFFVLFVFFLFFLAFFVFFNRYVREWLGCMVAGEVIQVTRDNPLRYSIREDHKPVLSDISIGSRLFASYAVRYDAVKDCFRQDGPSGQ